MCILTIYQLMSVASVNIPAVICAQVMVDLGNILGDLFLLMYPIVNVALENKFRAHSTNLPTDGDLKTPSLAPSSRDKLLNCTADRGLSCSHQAEFVWSHINSSSLSLRLAPS